MKKDKVDQSDGHDYSAVSIPRTLDECFVFLDQIPDVESWLLLSEDDAMSTAHMSMGRWIRNNWCLWTNGPLKEHLNALGLVHPDDMSVVILKSYYRKKHGGDIRLDEQIEFYKKYWKNN